MEDPPATRGRGPKRLHPRRVELYVPEDKLEMLAAAKAAMERDQSSLSAWFLVNLEDWWRAHKPGNPQLTLERFEVRAKTRPGEKDVQQGEMFWNPTIGMWEKKPGGRRHVYGITDKNGYFRVTEET